MNWQVPTEIPLPKDFRGFDPKSSFQPLSQFQRYERHLPHWRLAGACYFNTFRLDDSIPEASVKQMRTEDEVWQSRFAARGDEMSDDANLEWIKFQRSRLLKLESLADEGHGECLLKDTSLRDIVTAALHHFETVRCEMLAFAIMPNHVHALCRPVGEHRIESVAGSWKRHSAERINKALGRRGRVWQQETFDRIIRDPEHYRRVVRYIAENPIKAKIPKNEASVWFCQAICEANG